MEKVKNSTLKKIHKNNSSLVFTALFLFYLLLYFVIYFHFQRFTGDLKEFWYPQGMAVKEGKIPYRDFECHYSPLFPYLLGFSYLVFNHFSAPVAMFILFAFLTSFFLSRISEKSALLFLLLPATWIFTIVLYQNEIVACFFLFAATFFWLKGRKNLAFIFLALGLCFSYYLFALFIIPFFLVASKKELKGIVCFFAIISIVFSFFAFSGADILQPVKKEIGYTQGANIWAIFEHYTKMNSKILEYSVLVCVILIGSILIKRKHLNICVGISFLGLLFMMFSPKAIQFYALIFLPQLILTFYENPKLKNAVILYGIFLPFSYWFSTPLFGGLTNNVISFVYSLGAKFVSSHIFGVLIVVTTLALEVYLLVNLLNAKIKQKQLSLISFKIFND